MLYNNPKNRHSSYFCFCCRVSNTTNGALLVCIMEAPIGTTMKPKESDGYIGEDPGSICVKMRVY